MRKLKHRKVEYLAKVHTATEQWTQTLNPDILFLKICVLNHCAVLSVNKQHEPVLSALMYYMVLSAIKNKACLRGIGSTLGNVALLLCREGSQRGSY